MTISAEEGEFMLADWLIELERRGWYRNSCPDCGELMWVSPEAACKVCPACDPDWLMAIADYYPNEGAKA